MRRADGRQRRPSTAVVAVIGVFVLGIVGCGSRSAERRPDRSTDAKAASADPAVPAPVSPAFHVPAPRRLRVSPHSLRWAPVVSEATARSRPAASAAAVAHVGRKTPEGTTNIVLVVGRARSVGGELWIPVRLPSFGGRATAWLPRVAVGGYTIVHTHLVVELRRLEAILYRDGKDVFHASVGVGARGSPTPTGEFYIRDRLNGFDNPVYGPIAFGTSARSSLTDWPNGGFVGIHGTNEPGLIPGRISHGCIRLRNADILRLAALMPVGTPLTVR